MLKSILKAILPPVIELLSKKLLDLVKNLKTSKKQNNEEN